MNNDLLIEHTAPLIKAERAFSFGEHVSQYPLASSGQAKRVFRRGGAVAAKKSRQAINPTSLGGSILAH
jgi:hypothetical protein